MDYVTWLRQDGTEITTNTKPATMQFAKEHGWIRKIDASKDRTFKVERSNKDADE